MFSVTQFGKELDKSKYHWNERTDTFYTTESNLVLDFSEYSGVTFITSGDCEFITGRHCVFNTGCRCKFKTGNNCTFRTGYDCIFDVGDFSCLVYNWYTYKEIFNLPMNKKVKILQNGQLEEMIKKTETEIQIEKLENELKILKEKYLRERS